MKKKVVVLRSFKGLLSDIEKYTENPTEAVWFTSVDTAGNALLRINRLLKAQCWIDEADVSFPREIPYSDLREAHG